MIAIISIFAAIVGNLVLFRISSLKQGVFLFQKHRNGSTLMACIFLRNKIAGFTILGLIPGLIVLITDPQLFTQFGLSLLYSSDYLSLVGLLPLIVGINYFLAKYPATMKRYPEMRFAEWTKSRLATLVSGWTLYLFGYEFLFRGLLFFSVYQSSGLWASIIVNVVIYSAAHYPKGKAEMFGAIPFGILLCYVALLTGSFILPFLIHLSLALSTDLFSIRNNPEMKIVRS